MSTVISNAIALYTMAAGEQVSERDLLNCLQMLARNSLRDVDSDQLLTLRPLLENTLRNQQRTPALVKKWRRCFNRRQPLQEQQANAFIADLLSAIEDANDLLQQPIVGGISYAEKGKYSDYQVFRPYQKNGWIIHITTRGSGSYNCVRRQLLSKPGDILLFAPDSHLEHRRSQHSADWSHHWIMFQPQSHWLMWLQWPQVGPGIYALTIHSKPQRQQILALFDDIVRLQNYRDNLDNELRKNLLEQLLIRCRKALPAAHGNPIDERIGKAIDILSKRFDQTVSVQELASQVGLSASRLSALFKYHTGTSLLKWRDEQRMARACQLLAHSSKPISVIAETVGYRDPLYFTRCFRQHFSCSPRHYRRVKAAT